MPYHQCIQFNDRDDVERARCSPESLSVLHIVKTHALGAEDNPEACPGGRAFVPTTRCNCFNKHMLQERSLCRTLLWAFGCKVAHGLDDYAGWAGWAGWRVDSECG